MEASAAEASAPKPSNLAPAGGPAPWAKPLVKIDAVWTKIEMYLVLFALLCAIFYMTGWVTLNAFHTKGGKLAYYPGAISLFCGVASGISWTQRKDRIPKQLLVPVIFTVLGIILLLVAKKQDYFANIARWLSDASMIRQMGTPNIVSARLFTIWVALLGGSLATGGGRQINIDVVMRFIGPRPRLIVALIGYVAAASSCFVVAWAFTDYIAITGYGADKDAKAGEKISTITKGVGRHMFIARKQLWLDLRGFGHVVIKGEPFDQWYGSSEWNQEVNEGGWASVYPPSAPKEAVAGVTYPTKPCLDAQEMQKLLDSGGSTNPDWTLPSVCGDWTSKRPSLATAPDPDDGTPLESDLALLFPWGFFIIGCRFLLRGALALGGAVSTDPNAAHGADVTHELPSEDKPVEEQVGFGSVAVHGPIVETKVDQEARAHEGERALPPDDIGVGDSLAAAHDKVEAGADEIDNEQRGLGGEVAHHTVENVGDPGQGKDAATRRVRPVEIEELKESTRPPSMPPEGVPTAQKLEVARAMAEEEEEERTLVGDLSELARAQELLAKKEEEQERRRKEKEKELEKKKPSTDPKKGGK